MLERLPRLSAPVGEEGTMALRLEIAERGGDQVAVAENLPLSVPGRVLIDRFSGRSCVAIGWDHRAEWRGQVHTAPRRWSASGRPREASCGSATRSASAYYDQQLGQVPLDKSLYDVIPTCVRNGNAGSCRDILAGSASRATRYSVGQRRCPAASARASRWRC